MCDNTTSDVVVYLTYIGGEDYYHYGNNVYYGYESYTLYPDSSSHDGCTGVVFTHGMCNETIFPKQTVQ